MWSRTEVGGGSQDEPGRKTRYEKIGNGPPQNTESGRAQAEDNLKVSNFPIPVRPPIKVSPEPKKEKFILRMDKTFCSIIGLGHIQEENLEEDFINDKLSLERNVNVRECAE